MIIHKHIGINNCFFMKVELNSHLISRIENWFNNGCKDEAKELLNEVANVIKIERAEYKDHIEDLVDSIS